jgi:hypothetical protein
VVRSLTILSLIFTFVVALQNHTEYWVVTNDSCPPEMRRLAQSCQSVSVPCSELSMASSCEADQTVCPASAENCTSAESDPVCFQLPCAEASENIPCCLLVHPFLGELPAKLVLAPNNTSTPLHLAELPADLQSHAAILIKTPDPPWGVHPTISTTVLRI